MTQDSGLTFISREVNKEIGDSAPEEYLANFNTNVLAQHFIPTDKRLWKIEKFEKFLNTRLKLIWEATEELLRQLS